MTRRSMTKAAATEMVAAASCMRTAQPSGKLRNRDGYRSIAEGFMVNREHAQKLWNNLLELGPRRLTLLALVMALRFSSVWAAAPTI